MPNRYIRESAIESEPVCSLSWQGEVFWRRLLNRADDFGRYTANIALLRASIFPLQLDRVRDSDIPRLLAECEKAGLLFVYAVAGKQFLILNKWEKGRAKQSEYPPPPADICERMQTFVYGCKQAHAHVPDSDSDSDNDSDAKGAAGAASAPTSKDWLDGLCGDPAYTGLDVRLEHAKAVRWCLENKKTLSRRRFVNWLNRCDRPISAGVRVETMAPIREPRDWKSFINHEYPGSRFSANQPDEAHKWSDLDRGTQLWLLGEMKKRGLLEFAA